MKEKEADQHFYPKPVEEDEKGGVYSLSSGSGGYKASIESVEVKREKDGTYKIRYTCPIDVVKIEDGIEDLETAIKKARDIAPERVSVGMPGTGKVEVPDFDFSRLPEE
jgi:hypothetical protein